MANDLVTKLSKKIKKTSEVLLLLRLEFKNMFSLLFSDRAEKAFKGKILEDVNYLEKSASQKRVTASLDELADQNDIKECIERYLRNERMSEKSLGKRSDEAFKLFMSTVESEFQPIDQTFQTFSHMDYYIEDVSSPKKDVVEASDVSEEEMKRKVLKEINNRMEKEDTRFGIHDDKTVQLASGWIFHYDSEKYLETGKKRFMICGNYPVFISKRTQKIYFFYPGVTLETIEEEDRK